MRDETTKYKRIIKIKLQNYETRKYILTTVTPKKQQGVRGFVRKYSN